MSFLAHKECTLYDFYVSHLVRIGISIAAAGYAVRSSSVCDAIESMNRIVAIADAASTAENSSASRIVGCHLVPGTALAGSGNHLV